MKPFGIKANSLALALAIFLSYRGLRKKGLTKSGAAAAFCVGFLLVCTGLRGFNLIVFYLIATKATKFKKDIKEKLSSLEAKATQAERVGDYEKAADLKYGAIPDLKAHLAKIEKEEEQRKAAMTDEEGEQDMAGETVTPDDIAEIISRWTGIPVARLSQTERERLLKLDERSSLIFQRRKFRIFALFQNFFSVVFFFEAENKEK